jgi:hypothetical protein
MSKRRAQEDLFAECLSASETGSCGLDQCLAQHARDDGEWRDLISLALELQHMPAPPPLASFQFTGYHSLMREIGQQSSRRRRPRWILRSPATLGAGNRLRIASAWVGVLVAVILFLSTASAVLAAEGALPGDRLYGIKTAVEEIRLTITPAEGDVSLHARFAERRIGEIEALVAVGRLADVPQAAAEYETHIKQAIQVLVTVVDQDTGGHEQLTADLDQVLSQQTAAWDALADQMPADLAPVIQQAQSASADAQSVIRQLRTKPDMEGTAEAPGSTQTEPLPGATQPPAASTPLPPPTGSWVMPPGSSPLPPPNTSADLPPADTPPAPPASTPLPPPTSSSAAPPASTPLPPPADTPPASTPLPLPTDPSAALPANTPQPPPTGPSPALPASTSLPSPADTPPANTPQPPPNTPAEPPPADTPPALPLPGGEPPGPTPAGPPMTDAG